MIYKTALEHEIWEMKHAHEIHPEYDYEQLQEFIRKKYNMIMHFTDKIEKIKKGEPDNKQGELFDKI